MLQESSTTKPDAVIRASAPLWVSALLVGGVLAGCAILFWFDPVQHSFYPQCLFHKYTGWNCPGCGAMRAGHALLHGQLLTALRDNVLFVGSLPFVAFYSFRYLASWAAGRPLSVPNIRPVPVLIFLAVLLIFAVLRNIPIAPFTLLSPA